MLIGEACGAEGVVVGGECSECWGVARVLLKNKGKQGTYSSSALPKE